MTDTIDNTIDAAKGIQQQAIIDSALSLLPDIRDMVDENDGATINMQKQRK